MEFFRESSQPSDWLPLSGRSDLDRAASALMKIRRSSCHHVASGEPSDRFTYYIY